MLKKIDETKTTEQTLEKTSNINLETQVKFELPRGFVDKTGVVHKKGVMRLANAADEIIPLNDPRVKVNPNYLSILLLERVIVKLGTLKKLDSSTIESLFTADMSYLQSLYQKINSVEPEEIDAHCPKCGCNFRQETSFFGEA